MEVTKFLIRLVVLETRVPGWKPAASAAPVWGSVTSRECRESEDL